MVFSSHLFLFYFLPLSLLFYYILPQRGRHFSLTLFSYVFYGWANPKFIVLLFVSTVIDYVTGLLIAHNGAHGWRGDEPQLQPNTSRSRLQKLALGVSICANLALLGFFKYFNFSLDNYNALLGVLGLDAWQWQDALRVTLPLGISFYTFQSLSYTIDVYRGDTRAMRSFLDYACFVSMFHQLVAGPIIRFSEIADQLRARTHTLDKFARGAAFLSLGLAMKVLLANPCGKVADTVFNAASVTTVDAWYGALAYSFQIFFDFAGYSEMAIGLGLMYGFMYAKNFDAPYRAQSITDFWRRWHISLSTWLRDYLYIPLGGNRYGKNRTYINLMLVMLLGGLWHGASWNFVVWGGIHGGALAFERSLGKTSPYQKLPRLLRVVLTFLIVLVAWVFFRTGSLDSAFSFLGSMIGVTSPRAEAGLLGGIIYQPYYLLTMLLAGVVTWCFPTVWDWTQRLTWPKIVVCLLLFWLSCVALATQAYNPFIYFIF